MAWGAGSNKEVEEDNEVEYPSWQSDNIASGVCAELEQGGHNIQFWTYKDRGGQTVNLIVCNTCGLTLDEIRKGKLDASALPSL